MEYISRIVLVLMVMALVVSCSRRPKHPLVEIPASYKIVITKESEVVVEDEKRTFYPDPTRGYIENRTNNIFIYVWINPDFKGKRTGTKTAGLPDLTLPPKAIVEAIMPLGNHFVYTEGRIKTAEYGWKSVGAANKKVFVGSNVRYEGHYGWKVVFCQGDFPR